MNASKFQMGIFLIFMAAVPAQGFLIGKIYVDDVEFEETTYSEARSDTIIDGTTVGVSLDVNYDKKRWELRMYEYATGLENLKPGLDVTLGKEITMELYTYGVGHSEYGRGYYINGVDLSEFDYNPISNTLKVKFKPTEPVQSDSHPGGWTASVGMNINFRGTSQNPSEITYGPPIMIGNFLADDTDRGAHPSSSQLWGKVALFRGVSGEEGRIDYILGSRHAVHKGYDLYNSGAYVDGLQPNSGFDWNVTIPSFALSLGATEDFRRYSILNSNWSARDIQVGMFPQDPEFTHISAAPGGIQMYWDADTNKSYTLQYFPALGGPAHVLATNLTALGFLDESATQSNRYYRLLQE